MQHRRSRAWDTFKAEFRHPAGTNVRDGSKSRQEKADLCFIVLRCLVPGRSLDWERDNVLRNETESIFKACRCSYKGMVEQFAASDIQPSLNQTSSVLYRNSPMPQEAQAFCE